MTCAEIDPVSGKQCIKPATPEHLYHSVETESQFGAYKATHVRLWRTKPVPSLTEEDGPYNG